MKKTILLFALITSTVLFSQEKQKFEFKSIDSITAKKDVLFSFAKTWVSNTFNSSKAVIDMEDKDAGRIIGKGRLIDSEQHRCLMYTEISSVTFKFTIDVKDNKYRFVLSDFNHTGKYASAGSLDETEPPLNFGFGCGKKNSQRVYTEVKDNVKIQSENLLNNFKKTITENVKNDDF